MGFNFHTRKNEIPQMDVHVADCSMNGPDEAKMQKVYC